MSMRPGPGPNDYHIDTDGELQAGLGKDEPSEKERMSAAGRSAAAIEAMKQELREAGAELTERERALQAREAEIERTERAQEAEAKRLADEQDRLERLAEATREITRGAAGGDTDGDSQNERRQPDEPAVE